MTTCYQHAAGNAPPTIMVIIKHYSLQRKENSEIFYVRSMENLPCPFCDGTFKVIGSRPRILFRQDGSTIHLVIRRLQCRACSRISHELPDLVVPFKRYEAETIADALSSTPSADTSCCPCEDSTIRRWKLWFFLLRDYLEGSVRALMELWNCQTFIRLPLYPLSSQAAGWLNTLVRNLVNSGRWRQTCSVC